jgi:hypothetical protein
MKRQRGQNFITDNQSSNSNYLPSYHYRDRQIKRDLDAQSQNLGDVVDPVEIRTIYSPDTQHSRMCVTVDWYHTW